MYVVQWISLRRAPRVQRKEFTSFQHALKFFIDKEVDSYVERVELILDKGYKAFARHGDQFDAIEAVVKILKGDDDGADAVRQTDSPSK